MYTPKSTNKQAFMRSEKADELRVELQAMVKSPLYNTRVYSLIDDPTGHYFVEKHMNYMCNHPTMDHSQYVSNLRLMTKVKAR